MLDDVAISLYCSEMAEMLNDEASRPFLTDLSQRPPIGIFAQLLAFFQSFRTIEQTLFHYRPLSHVQNGFKVELPAPEKYLFLTTNRESN